MLLYVYFSQYNSAKTQQINSVYVLLFQRERESLLFNHYLSITIKPSKTLNPS